ncbi:xanthine dehydrogenase family protein molybdopterin-binding subunit [Roseateles sp. BYS96W]|uniref:Molybdopterin cofactor-binding domain-containing protein n=1 Tax=Pelomonas nitida TaxID=3299027 RepID=A0ABW7GCA4_9BURK
MSLDTLEMADLRHLVEGVERVWARMDDEPQVQAQAAPGLSRRGFMSYAAGIGGGLLLAVGAGTPSPASAQALPRPAQPFSPGAYVRIAPDGRITLYSKNPEIGQNIKTAFGLILAEELDARWPDVVVEQAPVDLVYGAQFSGGSLSVAQAWMTLRQAGAGARAMLLAAAAQRWSVPMAELTTSESTVRHAASGRTLRYGELATAAAALPVPQVEQLTLKDRKNFKLLGRRHRNVDGRAIVTGQPLYGIDVQLPDMRVAVFQKCPMVYGKVKSANLDEVRRLPGVEQAFVAEGTGKPTETLAGVVIIAKNTWSALAARRELVVVWDDAAASKDSWTHCTEQATQRMRKPVGEQIVQSGGGVDEALAAGRRVQAQYTYGFVAHGQLEPINCTAWYRRDRAGDSLTLWAPSQTPTAGRALVARLLALPVEKVEVHQQRIGGGFGRRLVNDYMVEAAFISRQAGGIPVKLMWTREDDMEHDFLRPGGFMAFQGALDGQGRLAAWNSHLVHFNSEGGAAVTAANWQPNEFPALHLANYRASQTLLPLKMPTGSHRAPGSNTAAWVVQCFLHE